MATMTVSLPGPLKHWIEEQVATGDYASTSDYMRDLVRRDKERREAIRQMTPEELREKLAKSKQSGISSRSVSDIFEDAKRRVETRRRSVG
jgi:antitoxin ParD1/3/4